MMHYTVYSLAFQYLQVNLLPTPLTLPYPTPPAQDFVVDGFSNLLSTWLRRHEYRVQWRTQCDNVEEV